MRYGILWLILQCGFATIQAAEVPTAGDVEVRLNGGITHYSYTESRYASATTAWLLEGGHQVGGGLHWYGSESDFMDYENHGALALYRYNWISTERELIPYIGIAYLWSRQTFWQ